MHTVGIYVDPDYIPIDQLTVFAGKPMAVLNIGDNVDLLLTLAGPGHVGYLRRLGATALTLADNLDKELAP